MKKQFQVTLDSEEVDKAEKNIEQFGGKLATLLNFLLKGFNKRNNGRRNKEI